MKRDWVVVRWWKDSNHTGLVTTASLLHRILDWLRAGYPEGVPGPDRVPLLALLRESRLTDDQIKNVVRELTGAESPAAADGTIDRDEIAEFIRDVTHHDALNDDIRRVAARLAAAGWPLAGFGDTPEPPEGT